MESDVERHDFRFGVLATSRKVIPKSKLSEWKGLDRISQMVHEMQCIWREQEKDDIGIDGEIELCSPRDDGDGLIGTGKIIKVQSKSGSRYVIRDNDSAFASPVEKKDLDYWCGLNVPAIYVVYHPDDDCLYWKHIQSYVETNPSALTEPHRIEFDKSSDRLDPDAYSKLCELCELSPERVLTDIGETLYTNVLPVIRMPEEIWVVPVLPEKQPRFHERLSGDRRIPPYRYGAGILTTITDPSIPDTAITDVIDEGAIESFELNDWLGQDTDNENHLRALLNSALHRRLKYIGLEFLRSHRRYFYNKGLAEDSPIKKKWVSSRNGREYTRLVAKHYQYGINAFYRHLSMDARFDRFAGSWGVLIEPRLHFSTDGYERWEGKAARSYAIRARSEQYNNVFLNDILFWAYQISEGKGQFELLVGDDSVAIVSGIPLSVEAGFSIDPIGAPDRSVTIQ